MTMIKAAMEQEVRVALEKFRPLVQMDGGDIELVRIEEDVVVVRFFGACDGCPMSPVTLKAGLERILQEDVPEVREVVAIEV